MEINIDEDDETKSATRTFIASLYAGAVVAFVSSPDGVVAFGIGGVLYLIFALGVLVIYWHFSEWLFSGHSLNVTIWDSQSEEESIDNSDDEQISRYAFLAKHHRSQE